MVYEFLSKSFLLLKRKAPIIAFLALTSVVFLLSSSMLLSGSCADIMLIVLIWCLPLFIH